MPTVSAARGCSPTARIRRPDRRLEDDDARRRRRAASATQIIRLRLPEDVAEERRRPSRKPRWTFGMLGDVGRRALRPVDVDEEVAGDPEREEVDRRAADDLVGAQVDREERVHERQRPAGEHADQRARAPRSRVLSAPRMPKNAPISIIPSRPMFTTPERSENMPAERGEDERRREAEHRGEQRRPDDDGLELADARARREVAEREPEHARGDREAAEPALARAIATPMPSVTATSRRRGSGRRART